MLSHRVSRRAAVAAVLSLALVGAGTMSASAGRPSPAVRASAAPAATVPTSYLVALGDSLAAGYQPSDGTSPPPVDPATGFTDLGYPGGYASDLASERHLLLLDLACPGETTASMTTKPAIGQCTQLYRSALGARTQLGAAETFLAHHKHHVAVVTLDLGANNIDGCVSKTGVNLACVSAGEQAVTTQLPSIVKSLHAALAVDDPGVKVVAMNYYDPFLALAYSPGGFTADAAAVVSVAAIDAFNRRLATIYDRAGVPVADVASMFRTGRPLPLLSFAGRRLPLDVDLVCRWTWMCPLPGSGGSANIHADTVGYRAIAVAFTRVLGPV